VKAFRVCDDESCIWARADTRSKAKTFWFGSANSRLFFESISGLSVRRQPWLDGPGPEREICTEWVRCTDEDYDADPTICFEGVKLDQARTLEMLGETE